MKKIIFWWTMCSLSCLALADDYSGAYFNINAGSGKLSALPNWEVAGAANAGYSFDRYFALEGGYNFLTGGQYSDYATVNTQIIDLAVKGTLPLGNTFSLYGRLGGGYMMNSWTGSLSATNPATCNSVLCTNNNANSVVGLAGVGMSFALDRHFDLRLENTLFVPAGTPYTGNINTVMLGFQYNFNGGKPKDCPASNNDYSMLAPSVAAPVESSPTDDLNSAFINFDDSDNLEYVHKHHCNYAKHKFHFATDANGREYLDVHVCDTLYSTARKTGVPIEKLKQINHLSGDKIEIGSKLYITK